jgi:hypothetical protein
MSDLFVYALAQMYEADYIRLRQHMMLFNTSLLMASQVSELADVHYFVGWGHVPRRHMSRILWPNGPRYTTPCLRCGVAYCVCADRLPRPIVPPMTPACVPRSRLGLLEHTRTPPSEPYTPTLSPGGSYSSAFANLEEASLLDNDDHDGNEDGSGDDNGEDNRVRNGENDMENNAAGNNGEDNGEDNRAG